jgi:hypothetical protein
VLAALQLNLKGRRLLAGLTRGAVATISLTILEYLTIFEKVGIMVTFFCVAYFSSVWADSRNR